MQTLQQVLKYNFNDEKLLKKAITHGSIDADVANNYERLEFLGDRVLGVAVAFLLYNLFPKEPEGNLSQRFVGLVCKETVADVARKLELDRYMNVASDDLRKNENVLCDVTEAIIGAIYIDAGIDAAIEFVNNHWRELIDRNVAPPKDSKTELQELSHHLKLGTPRYELLSRSGSEHKPMFEMEVVLENGKKASGSGTSKKAAEFAAATAMLEMLK